MIGRRPRGGLISCLPVVVWLMHVSLLPADAAAQELAAAVLTGEVTREGAPVSGQTVQVHLVSADRAGPIDSVATGADGTFQIVLPRHPDPGRQEVYFASTRYEGILYFGSPITVPADLDSIYALAVYDTTSVPPAGATLPVQVRNVFAEPGADGWTLTDLFEIRNDGSRTLVARPGGAVWAYPLFEGASDVELGDGDAAPEAFEFVDGSVRISAPVPPGTRLYVFRYRIPELHGALPLPGQTDRVELLIREPAPALDVSGLASVAPVEIDQGSIYRRFVGDGITEGMVRLTPADPLPTIPFGWLVVFIGLALAGLGVWATRQPVGSSRQDVIVAIAALDEAFESNANPGASARAVYERKRSRLLRRLERL